MATMAMVQGVCDTCGAKAKYKCPACGRLSCSLNCVKSHKIKYNCSGEVDPTQFLPKPQLLTTSALDRDYNFLQKIGRQIHLEKEDSRSVRVIKPRDQWRAGARVHYVGKGMSRSRLNRSKWNNSESQFEWTIEVRKEGAKPEFTQLGDKTLVGDIPARFGNALYEVRLLDVHGTQHLLNKTQTFQEAVRGKNILEFPTLVLSIREDSDSTSSGSDLSSDTSSDEDSESEPEPEPNPEPNTETEADLKPEPKPESQQAAKLETQPTQPEAQQATQHAAPPAAGYDDSDSEAPEEESARPPNDVL